MLFVDVRGCCKRALTSGYPALCHCPGVCRGLCTTGILLVYCILLRRPRHFFVLFLFGQFAFNDLQQYLCEIGGIQNYLLRLLELCCHYAAIHLYVKLRGRIDHPVMFLAKFG